MSYQNTNQNMIAAKKAEIANLHAIVQKREQELDQLVQAEARAKARAEQRDRECSTCDCSECTGVVKPLWFDDPITPRPNRLFDLGSPRPRPRAQAYCNQCDSYDCELHNAQAEAHAEFDRPTKSVYGYDRPTTKRRVPYGAYDSDSDDDILPNWARASWYSYGVGYGGYDSDADCDCQCDSCNPRADEVEIPQPSKEATTTKLETSQRKFKEKRAQKERKRAKGYQPVTHGLQRVRNLYKTHQRHRRRADIKAHVRED